MISSCWTDRIRPTNSTSSSCSLRSAQEHGCCQPQCFTCTQYCFTCCTRHRRSTTIRGTSFNTSRSSQHYPDQLRGRPTDVSASTTRLQSTSPHPIAWTSDSSHQRQPKQDRYCSQCSAKHPWGEHLPIRAQDIVHLQSASSCNRCTRKITNRQATCGECGLTANVDSTLHCYDHCVKFMAAKP
jgi:hypothetical protein